jgi:Protein of unknown function (DUF1566)
MHKRTLIAILIAWFLVGAGKAWPQTPAALLVSTDTDCYWILDGVAQGRLPAGDARVVQTTAGDHLVRATTLDGQVTWNGTATADPSAQRIFNIPLSSILPTWTDPATGLIWTKDDNGSSINWQTASNYCSNLRLAGRSDWRLPSIYELIGIVSGNGSNGWKVKGGLHVRNGSYWSNTASDTPGRAEIIFNGQQGSWGLTFFSVWGVAPSALCVVGALDAKTVRDRQYQEQLRRDQAAQAQQRQVQELQLDRVARAQLTATLTELKTAMAGTIKYKYQHDGDSYKEQISRTIVSLNGCELSYEEKTKGSASQHISLSLAGITASINHAYCPEHVYPHVECIVVMGAAKVIDGSQKKPGTSTVHSLPITFADSDAARSAVSLLNSAGRGCKQ